MVPARYDSNINPYATSFVPVKPRSPRERMVERMISQSNSLQQLESSQIAKDVAARQSPVGRVFRRESLKGKGQGRGAFRETVARGLPQILAGNTRIKEDSDSDDASNPCYSDSPMTRKRWHLAIVRQNLAYNWKYSSSSALATKEPLTQCACFNQ